MTSKLEDLSSAPARWENEGGHPRSPSIPLVDNLRLELQQCLLSTRCTRWWGREVALCESQAFGKGPKRDK